MGYIHDERRFSGKDMLAVGREGDTAAGKIDVVVVDEENAFGFEAASLAFGSSRAEMSRQPSIGSDHTVAGHYGCIGVYMKGIAYGPSSATAADESGYLAIGGHTSAGNAADGLIDTRGKGGGGSFSCHGFCRKERKR